MHNKINLLPNSKYSNNKQKNKKIKLNAEDFLMHIPDDEGNEVNSQIDKNDLK